MKRILLTVTIDDSLQFLEGFPFFLARRGWEVHVVSSPGPRLDRLAQLPGVVAHELPMRRDPSPLRDLVAFIRWIAVIRSIRPSILYAGTPKASLLGIVAAKVLNVPLRIYLLRGLRLETAAGPLRILLFFIERMTIRSANFTWSVSASLMRQAVSEGVVRSKDIEVIGAGSSNGVDLDRFSPGRFSSEEVSILRKRLGLIEGVPVVGFAGRIARDKGMAVLADSLEELSSIGTEFQVLVVGDVDDEGGRIALERIKALPENVVLTGKVPDTAQYMALMSIFCLPTFREGFTNVVVEASSMELPVVVTDATGVIDTVLPEVTGLTAEVGNSHQLAACLNRLVQDPCLAVQMGGEGRSWVSATFDRKVVQRKYAAKLEQVLPQGEVEDVNDSLIEDGKSS